MPSGMPRAPRAIVGCIWYHVMNWGNGRRAVFHKDGDYQAFLKKPWRAIWQRQLGGKDGEAFGITDYSAAPQPASTAG